MVKVEEQGRSKYNKFDKLDTPVLEAILRADFDAPEAERLDVEAVIYISNLLAEHREPPKKDTETAKAEFYEYYYPLVGDEKSIYDFDDEANVGDDKAKKAKTQSINNTNILLKGWRRFASVAAVFVIFMFGGTFTAYAFGYNPIAAIGRWTEDFFWFEDVSVTSELSDKLAEYGYPENVVPKWLPAGYTLESINEDEYEDYFKFIAAEFVKQTNDKIDTLIISYTIYLGDNKKALYEKDNESVITYEIKDRAYYVMTNLDDRVIAWQNGNFEGAIMGNFTIEEAEKIIKSIDGE